MKHSAIFLVLAVLFTSYDRAECSSINPVFKEHNPQEQEYKKELARIIDSAGSDAFDYWIARYHKSDVTEYLMVHIQNSNVCAIGMLENQGVEELEHMSLVGGDGYRGAQLSGLEYEVKRHGDSVNFVCTAVDSIID